MLYLKVVMKMSCKMKEKERVKWSELEYEEGENNGSVM
jgi:hypothetical protein